jgi:hypothetical protein
LDVWGKPVKLRESECSKRISQLKYSLVMKEKKAGGDWRKTRKKGSRSAFRFSDEARTTQNWIDGRNDPRHGLKAGATVTA